MNASLLILLVAVILNLRGQRVILAFRLNCMQVSLESLHYKRVTIRNMKYIYGIVLTRESTTADLHGKSGSVVKMC